MFELDLDRVARNVHAATTDDLLDRATVYRKEMEEEALRIIDSELSKRGVTREQLQAHLDLRESRLVRADGTTIKCSLCHQPAVTRVWAWQKLFGIIPLFPRRMAFCNKHTPKKQS